MTLPKADDDFKPGGLLPQHLADLRKSGLRDDTIAASGVYSESDPVAVKNLLGGYLTLPAARALGPCLAFPFRAAAGRPVGWVPAGAKDGTPPRPFVRLKPDRPRARNGKPVKYESPCKSGNRLYLPPGVGAALADPTALVLVVEGEKKALAGTQDGFPTLGLSGVWNWTVKRPKDAAGRGTGERRLIEDLARIAWAGRPVVIAFDSDLGEKPAVAWARWHLARALAKRGADVRVIDLPTAADGSKCGPDDFLVARGADALRALLADARAAERPAAERPEPTASSAARRAVVLGEDEYRVNAVVAGELAADDAVYQRGGELVRVTVEAVPDDGPTVSVTPRIEPVPLPALRDLISRRVQFVVPAETGDKPAHPPGWCVAAVGARGEWPGVRPLVGVMSFPVLRADGTVLTAPGYDPRTGLFLHWTGPPLPVPAAPTRADAVAAAAELLDAVSDFPFAAEMHRAAWLAALLTPLARPAFDGPAPLFLVDANVRAAGKGMSPEVISRVVTGNPFPVVNYPANLKDGEEELRKKITTFLMSGDRVALFDNLTGEFGDGTLAVLTVKHGLPFHAELPG